MLTEAETDFRLKRTRLLSNLNLENRKQSMSEIFIILKKVLEKSSVW
jgi:hypothetical protein